MSLTSIGIIQYSFNLGHKMTAKHSVLVDATMETKFEITKAHLWLEEFIGGDTSVERLQIRKNIDKARWYLNAMLNGGTNDEGVFLAIDEKYPLMRTNIKEALTLLDTFQEASKQRATNKDMSAVGSASDIEYDAIFNKVLSKVDDVETSLQKIIIKDLEYFLWIKYILILIIIVINLFILVSYKTILKFQREWFLKYFKVETEKEKLEKLYQDIRDAQALIDKYIPMSQTDLTGDITMVNQAMCDLTGYSEHELIGKNHRIIRFPTEKAKKYKEMWKEISGGGIWEGEVKNIAKCGQTYWVDAHIHPILDDEDNTIGYQALRQDITDKKKLEFLSSHDTLTSIFNRGKFDGLLQYEIEQFIRYKKTFSMAIFDLDHFKDVNDTYGHQVGDDVLVQSVNIMKSSIRESDVLARWGGEEFVLLLSQTNRDEAKIVVEKIRKSIESYKFDIVGEVTVSGGLSEVVEDDTPESILKRIDDALYIAKDSGRNKVVVY